MNGGEGGEWVLLTVGVVAMCCCFVERTNSVQGSCVG